MRVMLHPTLLSRQVRFAHDRSARILRNSDSLPATELLTSGALTLDDALKTVLASRYFAERPLGLESRRRASNCAASVYCRRRRGAGRGGR